jgi:hypothetical protein
MNQIEIARNVRQWLESLVIELNLCPFAKRELVKDRVRFAVTPAASEAALLQALHAELQLLEQDASIETTLLIHPQVLQAFSDYNQFLNATDLFLGHPEMNSRRQLSQATVVTSVIRVLTWSLRI